jgi:FHS family L-fucose permease-like MFS transporter
MTGNKRSSSLWVLLSVFFFWGFVAASNTVLIGLFKKNFELTQAQSQLVDLAFYFSYFVGAGVYLLVSMMFGDPLNKVGYKKGLVTGLLISAVGALCFIPAAGSQSFAMMLVSLFTIGLGFSLQQIVANPYVIALGDPATGSHRVSLAGGINSFGTTIGPLLLAYAIFGSIKGNDNAVLNSEMGADPVSVSIERTTNQTQTINGPIFTLERTHSGHLPYYYLANNADSAGLCGQYEFMSSKGMGVVIVYNDNARKTEKQVALLKKNYPQSHIPIITINEDTYIHMLSAIKTMDGATMKLEFMGVEKVKGPSMVLAVAFILFAIILGMSKLPSVTNTEKMEKDWGALKYPQVIYGMIAIFFYVGTEVATQSNLQALMKQENFLGLDVDKTVHYISLYWGCLMIGRWTGALRVFNFSKTMHYVMMVVVPLLAYSVILVVNYIKGSPMNDLLYFLPFVFILIIGFFAAQEKPARTMMLFGALAMLMTLIGLLTSGRLAVYCFVSCGLFCSVMWPCIFSLSTAGLGKYTTQASSLLIMMIIGGAVLPFVQGRLGDSMGIHASYIVPLIGFAYLTFYGWEVKYILQKQGFDYDSQIQSGGH